jgi:hypothetical protein
MIHMMMNRFLLALLLTAAAAPALAEEQVIALSPAEKEKLLDAAADRNVNAIDVPTINGLSRRPHGEIGMFVGSHGSRGVFGSSVVPIGEESMLAVSAAASRFGH